MQVKGQKLSLIGKLGLVTLCALVLIYLGNIFVGNTQKRQLRNARNNYYRLKKQVEAKQNDYAKLEYIASETKAMQKLFNTMLTQLPSSTKIDKLLSHITRIGTDNGLKFLFFKPEAEKNTAFYAQLPIQLSVVGRYHQLAQFISNISNLPELVTVNEFNITRENANRDELNMQLTIIVYRNLVKGS